MPRQHKYRAVKTWVNGIPFPSKREARRYGELVWLQGPARSRLWSCSRDSPWTRPAAKWSGTTLPIFATSKTARP